MKLRKIRKKLSLRRIGKGISSRLLNGKKAKGSKVTEKDGTAGGSSGVTGQKTKRLSGKTEENDEESKSGTSVQPDRPSDSTRQTMKKPSTSDEIEKNDEESIAVNSQRISSYIIREEGDELAPLPTSMEFQSSDRSLNLNDPSELELLNSSSGSLNSRMRRGGFSTRQLVDAMEGSESSLEESSRSLQPNGTLKYASLNRNASDHSWGSQSRRGGFSSSQLQDVLNLSNHSLPGPSINASLIRDASDGSLGSSDSEIDNNESFKFSMRRQSFSQQGSDQNSHTFNASDVAKGLQIQEDSKEDFKSFAKYERLKEWVKMFRRSDPRFKILNFFNDVAQEGAHRMDENFHPTMESPLLRCFYKSSVFTVWRPTSFDAIRRMMLGEGVGKGLDIKGKSSLRGKLSGFVPFLQIHEEEHKNEIRTLPKDSRIRVFYKSRESRSKVEALLVTAREEMTDLVERARVITANQSDYDEEQVEWALKQHKFEMQDPSILLLDEYQPQCYGIDVPDRLFWEGLVNKRSIKREVGSPYETGRCSSPDFQDMNFAALRHEPTQDGRRVVIAQYVDPNDEDSDPCSPLDLVMAYEENGCVMPVVSDFDCFMIGTRGVKYEDKFPETQVQALKWCISEIESILDGEQMKGSWTRCWLDVKKRNASKGTNPEVPPLGFSDPKTGEIMRHAIDRLRKEGAVRHGAECFNFTFPQELDDQFLVISDNLSGQSLPWKYVDKKGLQEVLKEKVDLGYTFPLNPKWVLCDDGWKELYDRLMASQKANVQNSLRVWYPEDSGIRESIECIYGRHPRGFVADFKCDKGLGLENDGTAAMDLAELELKNYLILQRAKRKLRGLILWKNLLEEKRRVGREKRLKRESELLMNSNTDATEEIQEATIE